MLLNRRVAVAALAVVAGALTGCGNPTVAKEPSLLWVGSDISSVTAGAGTTVYIAWDQRLSERVQVVAETAGGDNVIFDSSTAAAGDCIADVMSITADGSPIFGYNADVDPSSCLEDGAIAVTPTESTTYIVQGLRGEGRCDQTDFGVYKYPEECDFLTAPESGANTTATGYAVDTLTVTSGDDATLYYTVNDSTDTYAIGIYDAANDEFTKCDSTLKDTSVCTYTENEDADGNFTGSGTVTVLGVTDTTVVSIEASNGADDGQGDVPVGQVEVTISVG